jgi:hypothetical protein
VHYISLQEREEAARLFAEGAPEAAAAAEKTFEPGEGLAEAEAPEDVAMEAAAAAEPEQAPPSTRKGPSPEEMTAIKARAHLSAYF